MCFWLLLVAAIAEETPSEVKSDAPTDPDIKEILGKKIGEDEASSKVDPENKTSTAKQGEKAVGKVEDDPGPDLMEDSEEVEKLADDTPASNETETDEQVFLPEEGSAEKEHSNSLAIFFVLSVLILCVFLVHFALQLKCHYIPESLAIVFLGAIIGLSMKILPVEDLKKVESFSPTMFFLVLLPPIIFESGYNLHKGNHLVSRYFNCNCSLHMSKKKCHDFVSGNFFTNIGSILLFAIPGTIISALVVGGGIFLLGQAEVVYTLDFIESFAFGSLISAVDPVATLAIFQALDVDPVLNMLVRNITTSYGVKSIDVKNLRKILNYYYKYLAGFW